MLTTRVREAVERIRMFEPPEGLLGAFSGGKDSIVIKRLVELAKIQIEWRYNLTTADPPELVHFIKQVHPDVNINHPPLTMWQLIFKKHFPPLRMNRYCCAILKEKYGKGRWNLTGIRAEESPRRKGTEVVQECYGLGKESYRVNPIYDWSTKDVWEFIRSEGLPYCSLYDEGWKRLGCVMCCMASAKQVWKESMRWPKLRDAYERAITRTWEDNRLNRRKGGQHYSSGEEWFVHWVLQKGKK
jgi:phosphoadenosine phosphosulfate reductase